MTHAKCSACDVELMGTTARFCVGCFRKLCRRCPQCTLLNGRLHKTYRAHKWGKDSPCPRCRRPHPDSDLQYQLRCEMCNDERWVLLDPEPVR
jgi:hypothetical protein